MEQKVEEYIYTLSPDIPSPLMKIHNELKNGWFVKSMVSFKELLSHIIVVYERQD